MQGALFKLFVSNSSKCLGAPRQSVNLEVVRRSVVSAKGLSTCLEKMRVCVLFFSLAVWVWKVQVNSGKEGSRHTPVRTAHTNSQPLPTVNVFDPHITVEYQHLRLCVCTAHKQTLTFNSFVCLWCQFTFLVKDKVCVTVLCVFYSCERLVISGFKDIYKKYIH